MRLFSQVFYSSLIVLRAFKKSGFTNLKKKTLKQVASWFRVSALGTLIARVIVALKFFLRLGIAKCSKGSASCVISHSRLMNAIYSQAEKKTDCAKSTIRTSLYSPVSCLFLFCFSSGAFFETIKKIREKSESRSALVRDVTRRHLAGLLFLQQRFFS